MLVDKLDAWLFGDFGQGLNRLSCFLEAQACPNSRIPVC